MYVPASYVIFLDNSAIFLLSKLFIPFTLRPCSNMIMNIIDINKSIN